MHPYGFRPAAAVLNWCRSKPVVEEAAPDCPRCASSNTKFCYYNNYNLKQPRYLCKGCRRYWTMGGSLRNVPVGGRRRRRKKLQDKSTTTPSSEPAISDLRRRPSSSSSSSAPKQPDTKLVDMAGSWLPFQQTAADSGNNADGCMDNGIAMLCADIRGRGLDVPEMTAGIHHVEPAMEYSVGSSSNSVQQSQFRFHQHIVDVDDQLRNMGWSRPSVDLSGSFETQAMDHGNYFQCERLSAPCLMPEVAKYVGVFEAAPTDNNSIMPCTTYAYKFQ